MLLYADDLCLFSDSVIGLQKKIDILSQFCNRWGLSINFDKTEILVFRNGGKLRHYENWYIEDVKLKVSTYYNYLGVTFSNRLCWSKCVQNLVMKANRAMAAIKIFSSILKNISPSVLLKIFDVQLKPIILYGSEIWGVHKW